MKLEEAMKSGLPFRPVGKSSWLKIDNRGLVIPVDNVFGESDLIKMRLSTHFVYADYEVKRPEVKITLSDLTRAYADALKIKQPDKPYHTLIPYGLAWERELLAEIANQLGLKQ